MPICFRFSVLRCNSFLFHAQVESQTNSGGCKHVLGVKMGTVELNANERKTFILISSEILSVLSVAIRFFLSSLV